MKIFLEHKSVNIFQTRNSARERFPLNTAHITVLIILVGSAILTLPHWFEYKIVKVNTTLVVKSSAYRENGRAFYYCKAKFLLLQYKPFIG